ncbi:MAG: four helix bundle protein [Bacteroidales bacterium]|jgi:four helix bundle protein|nr:four helix bundle protein [Bacteroidales bacterium]
MEKEKVKLQDFEIYQLSMQLAENVWAIVIKWEHFAKDVLGKQWVRAIDSVAANISEGYGRYSFVEMRQFVRIARGSLIEHNTWNVKAHNRQLVNDGEFQSITNDTKNLAIKINNYLSTLQKRITKQ